MKFVSESEYKENEERQLSMTPETLKALRSHGVTENDELKLEFFFYSNSEDKASSLLDSLKARKYRELEISECEPGKENEYIYLVSGWTTPIQMNDKSVLQWTKSMLELGYKNDCDFDGWGTQP